MWNGRSVKAVLKVAEGPGTVSTVFLACAVILSWRALTWAPSEQDDAWAYTAWGHALARGRRPLYDHALTTPKPLGLALGVLVSPVSPWRAFQAAVILFLAMLATALWWGAFRESGAVGAAAALGALGLSTLATNSLRFALLDCVVASLVMVALVTRGRTRVACLFIAGLARPEAWLLCGVASYMETRGSTRRRVLAGALAAAAAPLVWLLVDLLISGDPLASLHRAGTIVSILRPGFHPFALSHVPQVTWSALDREVGALIVVVGAIGVLLQARKGIAHKCFDPLPLAVPLVWSVMIAIETRAVPFQARYLSAATMPLLLGVSVVVGYRLPARITGGRALATLSAIVAFAVATQAMPVAASGAYSELASAVPGIQRALSCGPLGITGFIRNPFARRPRGLIPVLAALTGHELNEFKVDLSEPDLAAVLVLGDGRPRWPTGWAGRRFGFFTLAVSPRCDHTTHP